MKLSRILGERLKEKPAECTLKSHILTVRGSYIKNVASGIFSLFAPAKKILRKIENIIREEMENISGQEVLFPIVMPASLWEETERYEAVGPELLRFKDRNGTNMLLGMTHEEAAVHLARDTASSYTNYPFMIFQIQTKFRDEPRARGGLIRVREFTMKDAYSFHTNMADLENYYNLCHKAYEKIFERVGLPEVISVESDSGMMGGAISHEFMLLCDAGEDKILICKNCDYKANLEILSKTFEGDLQNISFEEAREKIADCECSKCKNKSLTLSKGIEVGNIFQLGTKYTESMKMQYTDENGKLQTPLMGCYGIGIGRLMASVCEVKNDGFGPIWPVSIAPWEVHICALRSNDENVKKVYEEIYSTLKNNGIDVILDDRNVSAGVMFSDADLLGVPVRIIVSPKNLAEGKIEIVTRDKSKKEMVDLEEVLKTTKEWLKK